MGPLKLSNLTPSVENNRPGQSAPSQYLPVEEVARLAQKIESARLPRRISACGLNGWTRCARNTPTMSPVTKPSDQLRAQAQVTVTFVSGDSHFRKVIVT